MWIIDCMKKKQNSRTFELPGVHWIDLFNPYYISRKTIYDYISQIGKSTGGGVIMDFGCGDKPYKKYFTGFGVYIGCDVAVSGHPDENKQADVYYDGHKLPFESNYFDAILATQVLEHVEFFDEVFKELVRVLKRDGIFIMTVPFCGEEHEIPYDFRRFTSFGLKKLITDGGMELVEMRKSTDYKTAMQYVRCMYYHNMYKKKKNLQSLIVDYVNCVITNLCFILFHLGKNKNDEDMGVDLFVIGKKS